MTFDAYDRAMLKQILSFVKRIAGDQQTELSNMSTYKEELDKAVEMISADVSVHDSVLTLMQTMSNQLGSLEQALCDAGNDPAADTVKAALDAWQQSQDNLAADVTANTPAA